MSIEHQVQVTLQSPDLSRQSDMSDQKRLLDKQGGFVPMSVDDYGPFNRCNVHQSCFVVITQDPNKRLKHVWQTAVVWFGSSFPQGIHPSYQ